MNRLSRPRTPADLSKSIHRQLNMYALGASAAGVSLSALTQPAQAKIVYTPAHIKIGYLAYNLDLNHDGVVDFRIETGYSSGPSSGQADIFASAPRSQPQNKIAGVKSKSGTRDLARALKAGVWIGPKHVKPQYSGGDLVIEEYGPENHTTTGQWINVKNRYLALAFQIKGKIHYGWARLNVNVSNGFDAVITGYAYETIPGKAIVAGQTKGTDGIDQPDAALTSPIPDTPQSVTLGALALGAPGVSIWRREESAGAVR